MTARRSLARLVGSYYVTRAAQALVTLAAAAFVAFLIRRIGYTGSIPPVTPELFFDYVDFVARYLRLDLGPARVIPGDVVDLFAAALPWTLMLVGATTFLTTAVGVLIGLLMGYYEGSWIDTGLSVGTLLLRAIPGFVLALFVIIYVHYEWSLLPKSTGMYEPGTNPGMSLAFVLGVLKHTILIFLALVLSHLAGALAMRASVVRVLGSEFVRAARLRGLPSPVIATRYVGWNAVLPQYTALLIYFGELLGSTLVVEAVFSYPGLGYYLWQAASRPDWNTLSAVFLLVSVLVTAGVLLADLTYGFIDPRVSRSRGTETTSGARGVVASARAWLRDLGGSRTGDLGRVDSIDAVLGGASVDADVEPTGRLRRRLRSLRTPARIVWADRRGKVGAVIVGAFLLIGLVGPLVVPKPEMNEGQRVLHPFVEWSLPLGTNMRGEGLFGLMVHGTPSTLGLMFVGAIVAALLSTVVGLVAGYQGGRVDGALMTVADATIAVPGIPATMALMPALAVHDPSMVGLLLGLTYWGGTAREIRSQVLSLRQSNFVEAARTLGISRWRILAGDLLPHVYPYALTKFVDTVRYVTVGVMALYFLGAFQWGRQNEVLSDVNWGVILFRAKDLGLAVINPDTRFWFFIPLIAIVVFLFGLLLLAQALDKLSNPRLRARHAAEDESSSWPPI